VSPHAVIGVEQVRLVGSVLCSGGWDGGRLGGLTMRKLMVKVPLFRVLLLPTLLSHEKSPWREPATTPSPRLSLRTTKETGNLLPLEQIVSVFPTTMGK
jgi:hypothetical protein